MGATRFYATKIVDEVEGIESQVDPWIEELWPELEKVCHKSQNIDSSLPFTSDFTVPNNSEDTIEKELAKLILKQGLKDKNTDMSKPLSREDIKLFTRLPLPFSQIESITKITGLVKPIVPAISLESTGELSLSKQDLASFYEQNIITTNELGSQFNPYFGIAN